MAKIEFCFKKAFLLIVLLMSIKLKSNARNGHSKCIQRVTVDSTAVKINISKYTYGYRLNSSG